DAGVSGGGFLIGIESVGPLALLFVGGSELDQKLGIFRRERSGLFQLSDGTVEIAGSRERLSVQRVDFGIADHQLGVLFEFLGRAGVLVLAEEDAACAFVGLRHRRIELQRGGIFLQCVVVAILRFVDFAEVLVGLGIGGISGGDPCENFRCLI